MAKRHTWVASCLVVLLGCGDRGPAGEGVTVTDSAGVQVVYSTLPAWDSDEVWSLSETPRMVIGVVAGDEPYQFFSVSDARLLPGGGIVVAHTSRPPEWRIYDSTGVHVRSIGGDGEGPGEFRLLRGWLDTDDMLVGYDPVLGRITRFTLAGELVDARPVLAFNAPVRGDRDWPPVWFDRFDEGGLLGRPNSPRPYENGRTRPRFAFTRLDLATLEYDTVALALGPEYNVRDLGEDGRPAISSVAFSPISIAVAHDTTAFVSDNSDFWIEEIALGGGVVRRFGRAYEPKPVTRQDEEDFKAQRLAGTQSDDERRYVEQVLRDQVFAEVHPAHDTRMHVDGVGHLWVALRSPPPSEVVTWSIFDPHGVYLGDITTPTRLRITEVTADAVVGVWRDELDIQTVRVYDLDKPGEPGRSATAP